MFGFSQHPITQGTDWFVTKPALEKSLEWQNGMLAVMLALATLTVVYAIVLARKEGRLFPVYVVVGAAVACFYEPVGDLFAHVTYHEVSQVHYTTAFGFSIPLWVLPSYVVFFGFPVILLNSLLERRFTLAWWMTIFFVSVPCAWLFEVPILHFGYTEYYGANQPWKILNYPVWMGFVNTCTMFTVATAVHFLNRSVIGQRFPVLFIALLPMLVLGANGGTALPLGSAINSSTNPAFVNAMAWMSIGLAVLYVWTCGVILQAHGAHAVNPALLRSGDGASDLNKRRRAFD